MSAKTKEAPRSFQHDLTATAKSEYIGWFEDFDIFDDSDAFELETVETSKAQVPEEHTPDLFDGYVEQLTYEQLTQLSDFLTDLHAEVAQYPLSMAELSECKKQLSGSGLQEILFPRQYFEDAPSFKRKAGKIKFAESYRAYLSQLISSLEEKKKQERQKLTGLVTTLVTRGSGKKRVRPVRKADSELRSRPKLKNKDAHDALVGKLTQKIRDLISSEEQKLKERVSYDKKDIEQLVALLQERIYFHLLWLQKEGKAARSSYNLVADVLKQEFISRWNAGLPNILLGALANNLPNFPRLKNVENLQSRKYSHIAPRTKNPSIYEEVEI